MKSNKLPEILTAAIALVLGCILLGCEKKSDQDEAQSLTIYTYEEYLAPDLIELFTRETGIALDVKAFVSGDEMIDRIKSEPGRFDVLIIDHSNVEALQELRLAASLDREQLPGMANLDPSFLGQYFDPENNYSLPYFWGTTLVAYNAEKIESPEASWALLSNPELKDKVLLYEDKYDLIPVTLLAAGRQMNDEGEDAVEALRGHLNYQADELAVKFGSDADARELLQSGEVWAATMFSGDAAMIGEENPAIDFFVPEEGVPMWIDSFVIPRDTEKYDLAHRFIEFMLRPDVAAASSNYFWYASPNLKAQELLEPELLSDERINLPPELLAKSSLHESMSPEFERAVNEVIRDVRRLSEGGNKE